jgi:hypothetical protein
LGAAISERAASTRASTSPVILIVVCAVGQPRYVPKNEFARSANAYSRHTPDANGIARHERHFLGDLGVEIVIRARRDVTLGDEEKAEPAWFKCVA